MTFNIGTIEGGTHAGWRKVKEKPKGWMCITCDPFIVHPGYLTRCPECGTARDASVDQWACQCTPPRSMERTMHSVDVGVCSRCGSERP